MSNDIYVSPRHKAEEERKNNHRVFDKLADLALDGVITIEQVGEAYLEHLADPTHLWVPEQ